MIAVRSRATENEVQGVPNIALRTSPLKMDLRIRLRTDFDRKIVISPMDRVKLKTAKAKPTQRFRNTALAAEEVQVVAGAMLGRQGGAGGVHLPRIASPRRSSHS